MRHPPAPVSAAVAALVLAALPACGPPADDRPTGSAEDAAADSGGAVADGEAARPPGYEEHLVETEDGTRLFVVTAGRGERTVLLPSRLFAFEPLSWLADEFRLVSWDMRNRGRSDRVDDPARITVEADVTDMETIRRHFGVESFASIGYSYLGLVVAMHALDHPGAAERMVQIGPTPIRFGTEYPEGLSAVFEFPEEQVARIRRLREEGVDRSRPREYCMEEWEVVRPMLVGDPANAGRLRSAAEQCASPNEWPLHLDRHLEHHLFGSMKNLVVDRERLRRLDVPTLVIHGTLDRNAPYGAGREWALTLPDARLLTLEGVAHGVFADRPEIVRRAIEAFLGGAWPEGVETVTSLERPAP